MKQKHTEIKVQSREVWSKYMGPHIKEKRRPMMRLKNEGNLRLQFCNTALTSIKSN